MAKVNIKSYPKFVSQRVGSKVSWYTYLTREDADKAAKIAKHNAAYLASQGYDFGYCMPGSVDKKPDGSFEVCIP